MSAQYVFFRDPTGKATKRGDGKCVPTHMLADMGKSAILQKDGHVGWGFSWRFDALLSSFVVLAPDGVELNEVDTEGIVWKALADAAKKEIGKPLTASDVLKAGDSHAAAFFRQPLKRYVLVTSLSIRTFPVKRLRVRGCEIVPLERRDRFPTPKVLQSALRRHHFEEHLQKSRYKSVRVNCSGRTPFDGVENALNGLNLLRALWSFPAMAGRYSIRLDGGPRKPIGVIHIGPVHTLHNPDGSAADERFYWFDSDYTHDQDLFRDDDKWEKLEKYRRWATRKIASLPYLRDMEEILLRYIAALDQPNPNVAFLQLWGILEKITNTVGGKYDETVERACWVFTKRDRMLMKETLASLRHHRNRYVHSGSAGQESDEIAYRVKAFVDPHIMRLLSNVFNVKNIQEYGEILSYPTDIERLEKLRRWSAIALRATREDDEL